MNYYSFTSIWQLAEGSQAAFDEPVKAVRRLAKHQRARASDHTDIMLLTKFNRVLRNARAQAVYAIVHPDAADACFGAILHQLISCFRRRGNDDSIDTTRDGLHIVITRVAFNGVRVGVNGEYLITHVAQAAIDTVCCRSTRCARHTHYRNSLLCEKIVNFYFKRCRHDIFLL